jgi:hypothetical protein
MKLRCINFMKSLRVQSRPFLGLLLDTYPGLHEQTVVCGVGLVHSEFTPQPPLSTSQVFLRRQYRPSPVCEAYPSLHAQPTIPLTNEQVLCSPHVLCPLNGLGRPHGSISAATNIYYRKNIILYLEKERKKKKTISQTQAVTSIASRAVGDISGIAATEVGTFGVLQTLRIGSTATVINGAKVDDYKPILNG